MANNKLYGYTPDPSKEADGNRLDRLNPYEFKKGMDYELVNVGCYRLAESTFEERETATEKVIKNLQEYGGYYSALISYETEYRNPVEGGKKPSFKAYLKEMEEYQMIEVDKKYSNDKMTEPKYKKEDYTTQFKTDKMGNFKLKALKEAIKAEIINRLQEENKNSVIVEKEACRCGNGVTKTFEECNGNCYKCCAGKGGEKKSTKNEEAGADCTTPCPDGGFTGGMGCPKCGAPGNVGKSKKGKPTKKEAVTGGGTDYCCDTKRPCCTDESHPNYPIIHGGGKKGKSTFSKSETIKKIAETIKNLKEAKDDDFEDKEPTTKQIKGIDKSIGDAKDALARAMKKVKELAPDIKKLAKETNDKVKKNPAGKTDYLKTYTTNPDVKEFIKLRKMLKSADLL